MSLVKHFSRNTVGTDLCVGDAHGCFKLLQTELDNLGFDPAIDRLFSVGDLVDRGPDSELALEWLDKEWFHAVRGNHEDMAMQWLHAEFDAEWYVNNGGSWNVCNPLAVSREYADAFSTLPIAIDVETERGLVGIVHADCPFPTWRDFVVSIDDTSMSNSMRKAVFEAAMWSRERIQSEDHSGVPDVRAVIVGHTPVAKPVVLGNVYHIDTGACFKSGRFTFINLATLETIPPMPKKLEWSEG
jgi:serine/threonine protein phosphatase 1